MPPSSCRLPERGSPSPWRTRRGGRRRRGWARWNRAPPPPAASWTGLLLLPIVLTLCCGSAPWGTTSSPWSWTAPLARVVPVASVAAEAAHTSHAARRAPATEALAPASDEELEAEGSALAAPRLATPPRGLRGAAAPDPFPPSPPPTSPPNADTVTARVWEHVNAMDAYPEAPLLAGKRDVGLSVSGGGSRAFASTLGYVRGLIDLGLFKDIKYVSSVSGGSWAMTGILYYNPVKQERSLAEFLGDPTPPERMTVLSSRAPVPRWCARAFPVLRDFAFVAVMELVLGTPAEDVWTKAVHRVFLEPAGIGLHQMPAWSRAELSRTLLNNPNLVDEMDFILPCGGVEPCEVPFPIINTAMLGPMEAAPFGLLRRRYVMMEASPLTVGFPHSVNVSYPNTAVVATLGGLIEPVGFGAPTEPDFCGLAACARPRDPTPDSTASLMRVPKPRFPFFLANATAASSFAGGAVVGEEPFLEPLDNVLLSVPYFSPLKGGASHELLLGDGANMENQGIITLIRRGVRRVIALVNTQVPLAARDKYNPFLRPPNVDQDVDGSFAALFGVRGLLPPIGQDFAHDQVFSRAAFARVVDELQRAQAAGKGAVAGLELVTVANEWWGIPAGRRVFLTVVYLGRVYEWENRLVDQRIVAGAAPHRGLANPGMLPKNGTWKDFPHPSITELHLSFGMSNMLADLAWWVVVNNAETFERAVWGGLGGSAAGGGAGVEDGGAPSSPIAAEVA